MKMCLAYFMTILTGEEGERDQDWVVSRPKSCTLADSKPLSWGPRIEEHDHEQSTYPIHVRMFDCNISPIGRNVLGHEQQ
jgi:hypothetical protein